MFTRLTIVIKPLCHHYSTPVNIFDGGGRGGGTLPILLYGDLDGSTLFTGLVLGLRNQYF